MTQSSHLTYLRRKERPSCGHAGLNLNAQEWKEMNQEDKDTTLELCLGISSLNNPGATVLQPKIPVAPSKSLIVGVQTKQNVKAMPTRLNDPAASFTRAEPANVISSDATPGDNDDEEITPQTSGFKSRSPDFSFFE